MRFPDGVLQNDKHCGVVADGRDAWLRAPTEGWSQEAVGSIPGTDPKGWSGTTDYAQIRQPAERLGSDPRVCRFDSCSGYLKQYVLVEQRSARLPVTQEIVGSNPIEDAYAARYANR